MKKTIGLLLCLVLLLGGCAAGPEEAEIYAMDTLMTLQVWGAGRAEAVAQLKGMLNGWDGQLSVTREGSLVRQLNEGQAVSLTGELEALFSGALALSRETGGALDPCLYPVTRLWGFTTGEYRVPTQEELDALLSLTGSDKLTLSGKTASLAPGAQLDLGALVKGWAGSRAAAYLEERGDVACAILALGGNIQTFGTKPDGSPWQVGIQNPAGSGVAGILSVTGTWAVVTSGGYQRYFEEDGVRYSHIIDPKTGYPVSNGLASVTVLCQDGLRADGLSTALTVMGLEKAAAFWREHRDFEAVFILDSGEIYATPGAPLSSCSFQLLEEAP